jgi:lipid-A-disaccharide synthase
MFIAGEASGDSHASAVIERLRELNPDLEMFGAGGPRMKSAGMELSVDLTEHAVVGFVEVLKHYRTFRRLFNRLVQEAERRRPDVVVLVDYPGFNLRFARQMKKRGIKVVYYISPQLWAWHASRARQIERDVALMMTIFPFEKDWYAQHAPRLRVEFVGHPFAEKRADRDVDVARQDNLLLLLPGSRVREVTKIFPVMAAVVDQLPDKYECVAVAANPSLATMIRHPRVRVETGNAQHWMRRATVSITASGTATMECAFQGCPMLVVYAVNWLTYRVGRALVRVNWLGMPNVIAGREIVPEFIQENADPERMAAVVMSLLEDTAKRERMSADLESVVKSLGGPGASARAAELVLRVCNETDPKISRLR